MLGQLASRFPGGIGGELVEMETAATVIQGRIRICLARRKIMAMQQELRAMYRITKYGSAKEVMDLFIEPDIGLELNVSYPGESTAGGVFEVVGPLRRLKLLRKATQAEKIVGVISPQATVSLPQIGVFKDSNERLSSAMDSSDSGDF